MRYGALAVILATGIGLGGCGGSSSNIFGPSKPPPDPSQVLLNPPLSVPPGYGAPPQSAPADQSAFASDPSATVGSSASQTPGEQAFLQAAGAADIDPNIRQRIDQAGAAAAGQAAIDPALTDKLIFGTDTPAEGAAGAVIKRGSSGGALGGLF